MRDHLGVTLTCVALLLGCSSPDQLVSGRLDLSSVAGTAPRVELRQDGRTVASTPVAADGAFSLSIAVGAGYRIRFATSQGDALLVFPRRPAQSGDAVRLDATFSVAEVVRPIDLGRVVLVGDASMARYTWAGEAGACAAPTPGSLCVDDHTDALCGPPPEECVNELGQPVPCDPPPCVDEFGQACDAINSEVTGGVAIPRHNLPSEINGEV